ncbi:hypothetical protein OIU84_027805 [Salix udensis]|uniref:Uncharacterized protein n=1 Tax=Salix udensis TaxID=889485 RepID=A0AAD6KG73_9ROSI|nr:hypothetical protein OIU84_027805 [Salix udensis]
MAVRICKENPSVKIKDMAVRICEENPSAKMDYGGNRTERTIRRRRKMKESVEEIEAPDELKKLKGSKCRDMVDFLKSGWTLLLTNLILEITSAVFDQLGYALVGMVLAFVALLLSTGDLIHMARKERMSLLPSFRRPSTRTLAPGKPVGTIVEYFGWVGAVWQCFYSTVEYAYARQKKENPIKMTLLPFIFLLCVVISKLIKK